MRGGLPEAQRQRSGLWPHGERVHAGARRLGGEVAWHHFAGHRGVEHGQHVVGRGELPVVGLQQQRDVAVVAVGVGDEGAVGVEQAEGGHVGR